MGRGRGKGKKQTLVTPVNDADITEEEKLPASKRRGRPQKPLKDEFDEDENVGKVEDDENRESLVASRDSKEQTTIDNGKKRKKSLQLKENSDSLKEEDSLGAKSSNDNSVKPVGFRLNGNRRKSKPHRAAEAGVKCN